MHIVSCARLGTFSPSHVPRRLPSEGSTSVLRGFASPSVEPSADSQAELVSRLVSSGVIQTAEVAAVMTDVDRVDYCQANADAYADEPLLIGNGMAMYPPSLHALCLELLLPNLAPGMRVLDVGSGSGYMTAAMAVLVGPQGFVVSFDRIKRILEQARWNGLASRTDLLHRTQQGQLHYQHANALDAGVLDSHAAFDAIHVGAAAAEVPPSLLAKLAPGGRMVLPLGLPHEAQVLTLVEKDAATGAVRMTDIKSVRLMPLVPPLDTHAWGIAP